MLLKFLRKRKNMRRIMWGLALLIIPAFVLWGAGSAARKKAKGPSYAGEIYGRKVPFDEYSDAWLVSRDYAVRAFGRDVPSEVIDQLAWNRLLLLEEAKRDGINVKDKEVVKKISSFPAFQRNGAFDRKLYKSMVGENARAFEEKIRDDLIISKLRDRAVSGVNVTEGEVKREYIRKNEAIKARYIKIPFKDFEKQVLLSQARLVDFYNGNKILFKRPETADVKYIEIPYDSFNKEVYIDEEAIKKYFEEHMQDYKKPDTEEAPELTDAVKKEISSRLSREKKISLAEELAYKVLDEALEKKSLEEAAKSFGLKAKETGLFAINEKIPGIGWSYEFARRAFELRPGEISRVLIKTEKGFYIIQLKDKKEPYIPGFEEAREKVKDSYIKYASSRYARKKAEKIYRRLLRKLSSGEGFEEAYRALGISPEETDFVSRSDYVPGLGPAEKLLDKCSELKENAISAPFKIGGAWVIAEKIGYRGIDEKKFQKEKENFKDMLLSQKRQKTFQEWFQELKKRAHFVSFTAANR